MSNPSKPTPYGSARLLLRLIGEDPGAAAAVLAAADRSEDPSLLVAAALLSQDRDLLARAFERAGTARERQLVALADADLHGNADLFDVLVRDHLSEHPDHLLACWIAGRHH